MEVGRIVEIKQLTDDKRGEFVFGVVLGG